MSAITRSTRAGGGERCAGRAHNEELEVSKNFASHENLQRLSVL
jgi:hypothetical protein